MILFSPKRSPCIKGWSPSIRTSIFRGPPAPIHSWMARGGSICRRWCAAASRRLFRRLRAPGGAHAGSEAALRPRARHAGSDPAMGRSQKGITAPPSPLPRSKQRSATASVAIVPAVENGFAIGSDVSRLAKFRALGARYLTLTHNGHNALADSANPRNDLGDARGGTRRAVSPLGRAAIAELNRLGMLVDVAHASRDAMLQAAECSRTPVRVHAFLHPRAVRQSAQPGRRAARCVARCRRGGADDRGVGVPEAGCQARRRSRCGFRRPHRLRRAANRRRACRHIVGFRWRWMVHRLAGRCPRAPTSRWNCSAAATIAKEIGAAVGWQLPAPAAEAEEKAG